MERCLSMLRYRQLYTLLRASRHSSIVAATFQNLNSISFSPEDVYHRVHSRELCTVSRGANTSKPKAVIFDLGGVVVPSPQAIFDRFEERYKLVTGSLVDTIKGTGNGGAFAKMERGEYSIEQFIEPFTSEYSSFTGQKLTKEQVREFVQQLSDFTKLTPHPEVVNMFARLKKEGVKVAILTNNFRHDDGRTVFPDKKLNNVDVVSVYNLSVTWTPLCTV